MLYRKLCMIACILILLLMIGCKAEAPRTPAVRPVPQPSEPSCDQLAQELDDNLGKGVAMGGEAVIVGGTLIAISEPKFFDYGGMYPADYVYTLTFKGAEKEAEFKFWCREEVEVQLSEGLFYKFDLVKAFGNILSSGPHNSMFPYEQLDSMFESVTC